MTFADLKSSVLLTLLGVFAAGWLALYWIMDGRVVSAQEQMTAARNDAIDLHGQQGTEIQSQDEKIQDIQEQFAEINKTLGTLEERSENQSKILNHQSETLEEINAALKKINHTLTNLQTRALLRAR